MSLYLALVIVFPFVKLKGRTALVVKQKNTYLRKLFDEENTVYFVTLCWRQ